MQVLVHCVLSDGLEVCFLISKRINRLHYQNLANYNGLELGFSSLDVHSQKIKYIIVPLGVQWLVTGAVPSRVQLLYPWHRVHICTLVICTLRDQSCTCGDNFVPLFNSTKMDPSKRVQNWL